MELLEERVRGPQVKRCQANPRVWEVKLPEETESHTVDLLSQGGALLSYCTCSEQENPGCAHTQTVAAYRQRRFNAAAARRRRGLLYSGLRLPHGCDVMVREAGQGQALGPRHDLRNHSPAGLEWGYCGSGPAQLALAMLADYTGDDDVALDYYQEFKRAVIACLPRERVHWQLPGRPIGRFLANQGVRLHRALQFSVPLSPQLSPMRAALEDGVTSGPQGVKTGPEMSLRDSTHGFDVSYQGFGGCTSRCRVRALSRRLYGEERTAVLLTELPDNPGTTVTLCIERLATGICRCLRLDPGRMLLIEHYPERSVAGRSFPDLILEEHVSLVSCHYDGSRFTRPTWKRIPRRQAEDLLGEALPAS